MIIDTRDAKKNKNVNYVNLEDDEDEDSDDDLRGRQIDYLGIVLGTK